MARSEFPRARGGRGPQVGPGTFNGRSSPSSERPLPFSHIVWSRGDASPDVEVWCFLNTTVGAATAYQPIAPVASELHYAWLDRVAEPDAFTPPTSQPPLGTETELALKSYAVGRMLANHQVLTSQDDWTVRVARPVPCSQHASTPLRFAPGVFEVRQADISDTPVAWVWVTGDGSREIWALHRPGEPGGFAFVGGVMPGGGQPYLATQLKYLEAAHIPYSQDPVEPGYGAFINDFRRAIVEQPGSPVISSTDLAIHDYRIAPDV